MTTRPAPALPPRPLTDAVAARRAREAAGERAALAGLVLLALTASGFAGYGIATGARGYDVQAVLPAQTAPFAWKKTVAQGRRLDPDFDPLTTGSLPEHPAAQAAPGPVERPVPARPGTYALRRAAEGVATLEGPDGSLEIARGSLLPGAGRVLSIRRTGAGWVVITTETIIGPQAL